MRMVRLPLRLGDVLRSASRVCRCLRTLRNTGSRKPEDGAHLMVHSEYPFADLVAVKESDEDQESKGLTVLVVCADDAEIERGFCSALGRLVLMMDRDFEVDAFGLPRT